MDAHLPGAGVCGVGGARELAQKVPAGGGAGGWQLRHWPNHVHAQIPKGHHVRVLGGC